MSENNDILRPESLATREGRIEPEIRVVFDTKRSIRKAGEVKERYGIKAEEVALIRAGANKAFSILDVRKNKDFPDSRFLVVDDSFDMESGKGFLTIHEDDQLTIGRGYLTSGVFDYEGCDDVSRQHFQISLKEEALAVEDLSSSNGTFVHGWISGEADGLFADETVDKRIEAGYSISGAELALLKNIYLPADPDSQYGYYRAGEADYKILGRESNSVEKGAYINVDEVLLLDTEHPRVRVEASLLMAEIESNKNDKLKVLNLIKDKAAELLKYDLDAVDTYAKSKAGKEIKMSDLLEKGFGVCRHQGPLAAYFMECAIHEGYLEGTVGVERNFDKKVDGGHAWAVLRGDEPAIVVDPAQNYVGDKESAYRTALKSESRWAYYLNQKERVDYLRQMRGEGVSSREQNIVKKLCIVGAAAADRIIGKTRINFAAVKQLFSKENNSSGEGRRKLNLKADETAIRLMQNLGEKISDKEKAKENLKTAVALGALAAGLATIGGLMAWQFGKSGDYGSVSAWADLLGETDTLRDAISEQAESQEAAAEAARKPLDIFDLDNSALAESITEQAKNVEEAANKAQETSQIQVKSGYGLYDLANELGYDYSDQHVREAFNSDEIRSIIDKNIGTYDMGSDYGLSSTGELGSSDVDKLKDIIDKSQPDSNLNFEPSSDYTSSDVQSAEQLNLSQDDLRAGLEIEIKSGDSIYSIAQKFNLNNDQVHLLTDYVVENHVEDIDYYRFNGEVRLLEGSIVKLSPEQIKQIVRA